MIIFIHTFYIILNYIINTTLVIKIILNQYNKYYISDKK